MVLVFLSLGMDLKQSSVDTSVVMGIVVVAEESAWFVVHAASWPHSWSSYLTVSDQLCMSFRLVQALAIVKSICDRHFGFLKE